MFLRQKIDLGYQNVLIPINVNVNVNVKEINDKHLSQSFLIVYFTIKII